MLSTSKMIGFLPTRDAARARAFFEDRLGLHFVADDGFALVFEAGGNMIRVVKAPEFQPFPFTVLGWEVTGIASVVSDLSAKGVVFEKFGFLPQDELGIWTAPEGSRIAWFKDPDGNTLSVSEHPPHPGRTAPIQ